MARAETLDMADLSYAVLLEPYGDAVRVVVPAFPEIATFGNDVSEALAMARDAIGLSLAFRAESGMEIPPSDATGASRISRCIAGATSLPAFFATF